MFIVSIIFNSKIQIFFVFTIVLCHIPIILFYKGSSIKDVRTSGGRERTHADMGWSGSQAKVDVHICPQYLIARSR